MQLFTSTSKRDANVLLIVLSVFSISCAETESGVHEEEQVEESVDTVLVEQDVEIEALSSDDSLKLFLKAQQHQFIQFILDDNYEACQKMLCDEGVYFYTSDRIPKEDFTKQGLDIVLMTLSGAYEYEVDDPIKVVNASFWIDSLVNFRNDQQYSFHSEYQVMGFGFTGNYYDELMDKETGWPIEYGDNDTIGIIYTGHDDHLNDGMDWEILMVEFRLREDQWKIYAIGNLEWTP